MHHDQSDRFALEFPGTRSDMLVPRRQPFIEKLYIILEDEENHNLINWSSCGEFFRIFDCDEFSRAVLPRYFRHSNWTSFVRQLNMYDFHKIHENSDQWSNGSSRPVVMWDFKHGSFHCGATIQQLSQIKRKKPKDHAALHIQYANTMQMSSSSDAEDALSPLPFAQMPSNFERLERRLDGLSSSFDLLIEELGSIRAMVDDQNKAMTEIIALVRQMAETRLENVEMYTCGNRRRSSSPTLARENDCQEDGLSRQATHHLTFGVWDKKRGTGLKGSREKWEDAMGPFTGVVTQKRKLADSPSKEKSQHRNPGEGYSLGFILHRQPPTDCPVDRSSSDTMVRE